MVKFSHTIIIVKCDIFLMPEKRGVDSSTLTDFPKTGSRPSEDPAYPVNAGFDPFLHGPFQKNQMLQAYAENISRQFISRDSSPFVKIEKEYRRTAFTDPSNNPPD